MDIELLFLLRLMIWADMYFLDLKIIERGNRGASDDELARQVVGVQDMNLADAA